MWKSMFLGDDGMEYYGKYLNSMLNERVNVLFEIFLKIINVSCSICV